MKKILIMTLVMVFFSNNSYALELVSHASLPLGDALRAARAALKQCQRKGYEVAVAVVDAGGNLQVLLRDEAAGPHTVASSHHKAYTALSLRKPTHELAQLIASKPEIQSLRDMNEMILILGGGLPIRVSGKVVGGIGVGGAPGAMLDVACARAGIKAMGGRAD